MKLHKSSSAGVALVIVLGFLVIISALAVAFFSSVNTELKASRNFAAGVTTRQLADSAVQTVMGQIRDATSRPSGCWASQPGMIRVYRTDANTPSANADAFFKLYSSDNMVVTKNQLGGFDALNFTAGADPDLTNTWASSPAFYTDLNAPIMITDPTNPTGPKIPRFPIIDPTAEGLVDGFNCDAASGVVGATTIPGTSVTNLPMPVKWIYVLQDGTLTVPNSGGSGTIATFGSSGPTPSLTNPIVGRIAFWTDDETCKLNLNTAAGYNPNMPPASYTSDTYAGSFWDTPRFYTDFDMGRPGSAGLPQSGYGGLALCQLLQNEFQRYPGHPGTTSLNPVLGGNNGAGLNPKLLSDQVYAIAPRYTMLNMSSVSGSSEGGTTRVVVNNVTGVNNPTADVLALQPKQDRLYASVDELLYGAKSTSNPTSISYLRRTNNNYVGVAGITPQFLDKVRFFLTTQSRAPEVNLFGQPRVSIWPVRYQTSAEGGTSTGPNLPQNGLNAFDNTILFCSSVGQITTTSPPNTESLPTTSLYPNSTGTVPYRYIFTRRELRSPGASYTTDQLTSGYTSTAYTGATSGVQDINLQRNRQLITYLQNLTGSGGNQAGTGGINYTAIPGFGGNFAAKYGLQDRDSILTEIFDYIRCANSIDTTSMSTTAFTNGTPTGSSGAPINNGNPAQFAPKGLIMPSRVTLSSSTPSQGMGRFSTVSEATLVFYYAGPRWNTSANDPTKAGTDFSNPTIEVDTTTKYPKVRRYRAFLVLSTFDPMQGYAPTSNPGQFTPKISFIVSHLEKFLMTTYSDASGKTLGSIQNKPIFPTKALLGTSVGPSPYTTTDGQWSTKLTCASGAAWGGRNYGGYEGFMHTLIGQNVFWAPHKIARALVANSETTSAQTTNFIQYPFDSVSAGASANTNSAGTRFSTYQDFYELQSPDPDLYANAELAVPVVIQEKTSTLPRADLSDEYFGISQSTGGGGASIPVTVQITYGGSPTTTPPVPGAVIQTLNLNFPPTFPTTGNPQNLWPLPGFSPALGYSCCDPTWLMTKGDPNSVNSLPAKWETQGWGSVLNKYYWNDTGSFYPTWHQAGGAAPANTVLQAHLWSAWSLGARISWANQNSDDPQYNTSNTILNYYRYRWRNIIQPGDTVRSLVYCNAPNPVSYTNSGDMRLAMVQYNPVDYYAHPEYHTSFSRACLLRLADGTQYFPQGGYPTGTAIGNNPVTWGSGLTNAQAPFNDTGLGNHIQLTGTAPPGAVPARFPGTVGFGNLPYSAQGKYGGVNGVVLANTGTTPLWGDFDTGIGSNPDGPFGNKQDEGNVIFAYLDPVTNIVYYPIPYFAGTWQYQAPGNTYTSPSRQMPSPAMFGSLPSQPTSVTSSGQTGHGWQTLCFCPEPAAGPGTNHPGNVDPKDHLILDLFQMPVVEPYPISEPFSTAGKVNLNYHIAPFGYITRSTALRGALTPLRVSAVSGLNSGSWNDPYLTYKSGQRDSAGNLLYTEFNAVTSSDAKEVQYQWANPVTTSYRLRVNLDQTIAAFESFFSKGTVGNSNQGFFKAASQVCEMYLYPSGMNLGQEDQWWKVNGALTGDNVREKPYVDLYNRVTTKSNSYTVHMRVQTLRQLPRSNNDYTTWTEGKDVILGEYRGSSTIERYIDPADRRFDPSNSITQTKKDGINPDTQSVEPLYRFRTVITKKFSP